MSADAPTTKTISPELLKANTTRDSLYVLLSGKGQHPSCANASVAKLVRYDSLTQFRLVVYDATKFLDEVLAR